MDVIRQAAQLLATVACLVLASFVSSAFAMATINPVIIDVPTDGRAIFTIRNDRTRDVLYQISVFSWHIVNGEDRYEATQDFIASPPLFNLTPSISQIVRIGFRNPVKLPVEQAYRLEVAEVPRPGDSNAASGRVEFSFKYLLPVYVASSNRSAKPILVWSMHAEDNSIVVRAENRGNKHAVVNMVGLNRQSSDNLVPEYFLKKHLVILAGAWRQWRIPVPAEKISLAWRILFENEVGIRAASVSQ
jgi:fimbrial chaperone protein